MIIAVDFDGVLVEDKFPKIGKPKKDTIRALWWAMRTTGHEFILWTSRVDDRLQEAIEWCTAYNLTFVAINGGAPSNLDKYPTDPRKVYADIYIDDHAIGYTDKVAARVLENLTKMEVERCQEEN